MGNPTMLPSGRAARTICGWAKSNSTAAGYRWIASYGTNSTGEAMFIGMNGTTLDAGAYASDLTVANFWDTNWHFIALTYDGTTANLYDDGVLKASAAETWGGGESVLIAIRSEGKAAALPSANSSGFSSCDQWHLEQKLASEAALRLNERLRLITRPWLGGAEATFNPTPPR